MAFRACLLELGTDGPDDKGAKFLFVEGLRDNLKTQVLLQRPQMLAAAIQLAEIAGGSITLAQGGSSSSGGAVPMELGTTYVSQPSSSQPA